MDPDAIGQFHENRVWDNLSTRSGGALHVFLPTLDVGVDGIVRRPDSDAMVPVQVKGRSSLGGDNVLRIHVQENETTDDRIRVIAVLSDIDTLTLRSPALVMTVAELKQRSRLIPYGAHRRGYPIEVPFPPGHRTRWRAVAFPLQEMGDRVCPAGNVPLSHWMTASAPARDAETGLTGYRGEAEFIHCVAATGSLNIFHALPDNEFDEYLLRHVVTGGIHGIQVKCVEVTPTSPIGSLHVAVRTFHASRRASLVAFAWVRGLGMHPECLLIPALDLPRVFAPDRNLLRLDWQPGATDPTGPAAPYRIPLSSLGPALETRAADDRW